MIETLVCIFIFFFPFGVFGGGLVLGISCAFSGVNVELGALGHGMIPRLDGISFQGGKEGSKNPVLLLYRKPMQKGKNVQISSTEFFPIKFLNCYEVILLGV